ncbi:MAG: IS1182 family transposase [Fuerstiella sp.]
MMKFAKVKQARNQQVLFPERLDEAVDDDHDVRLVDRILHSVDFSEWEARYHLAKGQPPIHPRVMAGVILYGLLCRISSSRALEEALQVRLDFRWLAEGRRIDHSTICKFRIRHADELKKLYVQFAMIGIEFGWVRMTSLGFDGTRIRANNSRRASRTPERLRQLKKELEKAYEQHDRQAREADRQDEERFGERDSNRVDADISDVKRELEKVNAALEQVELLEENGKTVPKRIPMTDPESRIMPNKTGGHAPNFTPATTVDIDSGMIVDSVVLNVVNEDDEMLNSVARVQDNFNLPSPPDKLLADGLMATGDNISQCNEQGIALYAPVKTVAPATNPAVRTASSEPVAEEDRDRLPRINVTVDGVKRQQLSKDAFIYDASDNCYRCPMGKRLSYRGSTHEKRSSGRTRTRHRYRADSAVCQGCPLADVCLRRSDKGRQVTHEQHEQQRVAHAEKMATTEAKEIYKTRQHAGERPFAMMKWFFRVDQFLTRGLDRVSQEYNWLSAGFNLHRLLSLIRHSTGPPRPKALVLYPSLSPFLT